jgi:ankyrin repeat protein
MRAVEMMEGLLAGESLLPKEREHIKTRLGWAADARAAMLSEHLARSTAQVDRLVEAGLIDRDSGDRAIDRLRTDKEWHYWERADHRGAIEAFRASGIVHGLNVEGRDDPPGHDDLIRDLAGISQGAFRPEGVFQLRENWIGRGHDYPVQFVHQGRLYRFDVAYRGDDHDVDAVVEAANEALEDAGEPRRFVDLGVSSPRDVMIAFCDPVALFPIAEELALKPRVPFAPFVGSVARLGDASRHRIWDEIAVAIGDVERTLSIAELVRWRDPATGVTALHHVVRTAHTTMRHSHADRVNVLIQAGADVNARSFAGRTPLDEIIGAESSERSHLLEALLHGGADIQADGSGLTVLHRAAEVGDRQIVARLLDRGADPNRREATRGFTPLHSATHHWQADVARLLLDRGADIHARTRRPGRSPDPPRDRPDPIDITRSMVASRGPDHLLCDGQTALHVAVIMGQVAVFELLIERGADVNAIDDRVHTPLDLAMILDRRRPFGNLLEDRGGKRQECLARAAFLAKSGRSLR